MTSNESKNRPAAIVRSVNSPGPKGVRVLWIGGFPQIGMRLYASIQTSPQVIEPKAQLLARMFLCYHYADEFERSDIEALCWEILGCKDRAITLSNKIQMPMTLAIELAMKESEK